MKCRPYLILLPILLMSCSSKEIKMENNPRFLTDYVGKMVQIEGKVSDMPWQHMIDMREDYPYMIYLDWEHDQTVVYSREPVKCQGALTVQGQVIRLEGQSKRPGSQTHYSELQILADRIICQSERPKAVAIDPENLSDYVGQVIELNGEITGIMWQHMMGFNPDYPYDGFLDWKGTQLVFYSKAPIDCKGKTRVIGKLIEISGAGKGEAPDNLHSEYQVLAELVECKNQ